MLSTVDEDGGESGSFSCVMVNGRRNGKKLMVTLDMQADGKEEIVLNSEWTLGLRIQ